MKADHSEKVNTNTDLSGLFESLTNTFRPLNAISTQSPFWLKLLLRHVAAVLSYIVIHPAFGLSSLSGDAGY
jgi:hypothetical protein